MLASIVGIINAPNSFAQAGSDNNKFEQEIISSRAVFSINYLGTFENTTSNGGEIETENFYSGTEMVIKCNISHDDGENQINNTNISIINKNNGEILLEPTDMEKNTIIPDDNWVWYRKSYTFPKPTPRGEYFVIVQSISNPPSSQKIDGSVLINILNEHPNINGTIPTFYKNEKDQPWTYDLSRRKSDLEDSGENLSWKIENVSNSLLKVNIDKDLLKFEIVPYSFGSNELTLILVDSDFDRDTTEFWVHVEPVNDPPIITPKIPDQVRAEDSKPWHINLTEYGYDIEDSLNNRFLKWSVFDVNESLLEISIESNSLGNKLRISPIANTSGSNLITLKVEDTEGLDYTQQLWINITVIDDPPIWIDLSNELLNLTSKKNLEIFNLYEHVSDVDTAKDELVFKIESVTSTNVNCSIDDSGNLNIIFNETSYIGSGDIEISVSDGTNVAITKIKYIAKLSDITVILLAPEDDSTISTDVPTLFWNLSLSYRMTKVKFNVYFHEDETLVIQRSPQALIASNLDEEVYTLPYQLDNDKLYYWTVVPIYIDDNQHEHIGSTVDNYRNFRVYTDSDNSQPIALLLTPNSKEVLQQQTVYLTWMGYDPDGDSPIIYDLYLSTNRQLVLDRDLSVKIDLQDPLQTSYNITNLTDDEIYYWAIIPTAKEMKGFCNPVVSSFAIDRLNSIPTTTLLLPKDKSILQKSPILYWDYEDPDPFETIYFEIYFDENKELVSRQDPNALIATLKDTTHYYLSAFKSDKKYYWTVISNDKIGPGICDCGIWEFTINDTSRNFPPVVWLNEPLDGSTVNNAIFDLTWNGNDDDDRDIISFSIYISDDYQLVSSLDKSVRITTTTESQLILSNLTEGVTYYWTVIPDDGKVYGLCMDDIWSFEYKTESKSDNDAKSKITPILSIIQIFSVIVIISILISASIGIIHKQRKKKELAKFLSDQSGSTIGEDVKSELVSHRTYKALHIDQMNSSSVSGLPSSSVLHGGIRKRKKQVKVVGKIDKHDIMEKIHEEDVKSSKEVIVSSKRSKKQTGKSKEKSHSFEKRRPRPYIDGDYDLSLEKSRYKPLAGLKAEQIKRAIPYAKGSQKDNHILTKKEIKLASPMNKKFSSKKAIKASSLPITRQCPKCGSFKVKTFKDDSNKCLECKNRF